MWYGNITYPYIFSLMKVTMSSLSCKSSMLLRWNKKNLSLKLDVIGLSELRCGNRQDIHLKHCMGLKIKPLFRRTNNSWLHKMTAEKRCALYFDYFVMSKFQGQPSYQLMKNTGNANRILHFHSKSKYKIRKALANQSRDLTLTYTAFPIGTDQTFQTNAFDPWNALRNCLSLCHRQGEWDITSHFP